MSASINREEWTWDVCRADHPRTRRTDRQKHQGKRRRTVPITEPIRPMVARHHDRLRHNATARLFTDPRGGRVTTAILRDATHWDELVVRPGYEHLRQHDYGTPGLPGSRTPES